MKWNKILNHKMLDALLKLEIGRMSDEEVVKFYAEKEGNFYVKEGEKYRNIDYIPFVLEKLGKKSLLNRVASDLAIKIDLDYQKPDYVDLIKASVDRLQKQENGDKKIRKWIKRVYRSLDDDSSEIVWVQVNERIKEKVENIKVLEKKIIDFESEKQKSKLLDKDKLYEEFDQARELLASICWINNSENLSDLVDAVYDNAKWISIKVKEVGYRFDYFPVKEYKFDNFAVSDKQALEKILKENNLNYRPIMDQHWVFEVYEPSSNLNLVGKMLVDNAADFNNYQEDSDIDNFVDAILDRKIVSFESQNFGFSPEIEKEVQKETKAKTLKMKM